MTRFARTTLLAVLFVSTLPLPAQKKETTERSVRVSFVGCKADGQMGPEDAPSGEPVTVVLPSELTDKFAYYKGPEGSGVLAPKGWNCFQAYGSSGSYLLLSPGKIDAGKILPLPRMGFSGPIIQLSIAYGGTSGRVVVAALVARLFPEKRSFVQDQVRAGLVNKSELVYAPYATDRLTRPDRNTVEFQTPANTDGLGTMSRLHKSSNPISGVVMLTGEDPDAVHLSVRLSPDQASLAPYIIQRLETEIRSAK